MKVLVLTSDNYMKIIPAFAHLFNTYWGKDQQVIVCGFSAPEFALPDNFTFFSIGPQSAYPFKRWSDALVKVLQAFPMEKHFVLMLEDFLLVQPVRRNVVDMALDYMRQFNYVLKFDLCADRRYSGYATDYGLLGDIPLVKSDPTSQYHSSLYPGLWNRDLMLKYLLVPNESPHDIELSGTPRLASYGDEVVVVGTVTDPWPVKITLGFRSQNPDGWQLEGLSEQDVMELRQKGLIP